jgi:DNA-binding GntR family transcriptional regulator
MNETDNRDDLITRLEYDILSCRFTPRQRLVESELMKRYGVTRNSLRNAFKELQAKKLIVHSPNRGVAVAEVTEKESKDLYKTRVLLESYAAFQIMTHLTAAQWKEIELYHKHFITAVEQNDFRRMSEANNRFHERTFQSSGNLVVSGLISELRTRANLLLYHIWRYPGQLERSIRDHRALLSALADRDRETFIRVNARHVLASLEGYTGKSIQELGLERMEAGSFEAGELFSILS